jgi:hypothetical protein
MQIISFGSLFHLPPIFGILGIFSVPLLGTGNSWDIDKKHFKWKDNLPVP